MGEDFNIRTGELGGMEIQGKKNKRKSKDKGIGEDGRMLIEWIQEKGWYILNGTVNKD